MKKQSLILGQSRGNEYSKVARETEAVFREWLVASNVTSEQLKQQMSAAPYRIDATKDSDGNIHVQIYSGNTPVLLPLVWMKHGTIDFDEFSVDVSLMLFRIVSLLENSVFTEAVRSFSRKWLTNK